MPFSSSVICRSINPQSVPKIVQKLHTSMQTTDINNAHVKITEMAKKVRRKPHISNRKCGANTRQNGNADFPFLSSVGRMKSNSPIDLHSIHLIPLNSWSPFSDICRSAQRSSFERKAKVIGPVCGCMVGTLASE